MEEFAFDYCPVCGEDYDDVEKVCYCYEDNL